MKKSSKQNKKKGSKSKNKISFDEEVVNKDQAEKLLSEERLHSIKTKQITEKNEPKTQTKRKIEKRKQVENNVEGEKFSSKKKRNSHDKATKIGEETADLLKKESVEQELPIQSKKESIRARKRKKHVQLLEEKKLNAELDLQKKALNYLSKWKHSRSDWKFEKLKQVWIQQNLFDSTKIPNEFWETTLEYFSGTKGHSRQVALDESLKIIETEEGNSETLLDEDYQVKLKRARSIVQSLQ